MLMVVLAGSRVVVRCAVARWRKNGRRAVGRLLGGRVFWLTSAWHFLTFLDTSCSFLSLHFSSCPFYLFLSILLKNLYFLSFLSLFGHFVNFVTFYHILSLSVTFVTSFHFCHFLSHFGHFLSLFAITYDLLFFYAIYQPIFLQTFNKAKIKFV